MNGTGGRGTAKIAGSSRVLHRNHAESIPVKLAPAARFDQSAKQKFFGPWQNDPLDIEPFDGALEGIKIVRRHP
jgi:hypothetical protein